MNNNEKVYYSLPPGKEIRLPQSVFFQNIEFVGGEEFAYQLRKDMCLIYVCSWEGNFRSVFIR